ncbi:hypothetical protein KI387_016531 [Taxus chinensis]|uniref:Uncharacterized protein n=1 Tax=Taxus chinensis TaxID=29808 RepID=A0AA38LI61_TAXCH|nr:hypothetical protein KI387_016531 [Taxus chinensis]
MEEVPYSFNLEKSKMEREEKRFNTRSSQKQDKGKADCGKIPAKKGNLTNRDRREKAATKEIDLGRQRSIEESISPNKLK